MGYVSDNGEQRAKGITKQLEDLRDAIDGLLQAEAKERLDTASPDDAFAWLQRRREVLGSISTIEKQLAEAAATPYFT